MMRMIVASTMLAAVVGACAPVANPAVPGGGHSADYTSAYMAGCDSGFMDAGRDGFQNTFQKDGKLFETDPEYRLGWNDGHAACFAAEHRTPSSMPGL
jgi:hypothetical protein